jgi:hypothetical protein
MRVSRHGCTRCRGAAEKRACKARSKGAAWQNETGKQKSSTDLRTRDPNARTRCAGRNPRQASPPAQRTPRCSRACKVHAHQRRQSSSSICSAEEDAPEVHIAAAAGGRRRQPRHRLNRHLRAVTNQRQISAEQLHPMVERHQRQLSSRTHGAFHQPDHALTPSAAHCAALSGKLTPNVAAYTPTRSMGPVPPPAARSKLHLGQRRMHAMSASLQRRGMDEDAHHVRVAPSRRTPACGMPAASRAASVARALPCRVKAHHCQVQHSTVQDTDTCTAKSDDAPCRAHVRAVVVGGGERAHQRRRRRGSARQCGAASRKRVQKRDRRRKGHHVWQEGLRVATSAAEANAAAAQVQAAQGAPGRARAGRAACVREAASPGWPPPRRRTQAQRACAETGSRPTCRGPTCSRPPGRGARWARRARRRATARAAPPRAAQSGPPPARHRTRMMRQRRSAE